MTEIVKRFIAGATCPQCHLIDKIVVYTENEAEFCECVRCGHKQQQELDPTKKAIAKVGEREHIIKIVRAKKSLNAL